MIIFLIERLSSDLAGVTEGRTLLSRLRYSRYHGRRMGLKSASTGGYLEAGDEVGVLLPSTSSTPGSLSSQSYLTTQIQEGDVISCHQAEYTSLTSSNGSTTECQDITLYRSPLIAID